MPPPGQLLRSVANDALTPAAVTELRGLSEYLNRIAAPLKKADVIGYEASVTDKLAHYLCYEYELKNFNTLSVPLSCAVDYCATIDPDKDLSVDQLFAMDRCLSVIDRALSKGGMAQLWNALGIQCMDQRQAVLKKALRNTHRHASLITPKEESQIQQEDLPRFMAYMYAGMLPHDVGVVSEHPLHAHLNHLSLDFLLHDDRQAKRAAAYDFTKHLNKAGFKGSILLVHWPATLCQIASLSGYPADVVLRGVEPIIEGILDTLGDYSSEQKLKLIRRTKVMAAMGFNQLIAGLDLRRDDVGACVADRNDGDDIRLLHASPLTHDFMASEFTVVYENMIKSLEHSRIPIDLDMIMNVNEHQDLDAFLGNGLLFYYASTAPDRIQAMREAVNHPSWLTHKNLSLPPLSEFESVAAREVVAMHAARSALGLNTAAPKDIVPYRLRENKGEGAKQFSRSEQADMVRILIEKNLICPNACHYLDVDDDVLKEYKNKLPDLMKGHLLEIHMSL